MYSSTGCCCARCASNHCRHTFSKVLSVVLLYRKCTRALTFQNVCYALQESFSTQSKRLKEKLRELEAQLKEFK